MSADDLLNVIATLVWVACAYSAWRWSRAARAERERAEAAYEELVELKRDIDRLVADNNARMAEWIA